MSASDLLSLFLHFASLSLLSIGGAIMLVPEMHRIVVDEMGWLGDYQFTSSIALAQASPGPNILFVTLIGWNAGGTLGAMATTIGIMLPSSVLALHANRWALNRADHPLVKAFRLGMIPITIGLLLATAWILAEPNLGTPVLMLISLASLALTIRTKLNPLWLIGTGGLAGVLLGG
jgi:chromate transporter